MTRHRATDLGTLLEAAARGEPSANERLWGLVYDELRRLAHGRLAPLGPGETLQTTALVHEAYLKLSGGKALRWDDAAHFYGAAARAMRNILVDEARRKGRLKRGAKRTRIVLAEDAAQVQPRGLDLLALDQALERLAASAPRIAQVVTLRYFGGLSIEECARVVGVSTATVERDWKFARAWLQRELGEDGESGPERD